MPTVVIAAADGSAAHSIGAAGFAERRRVMVGSARRVVLGGRSRQTRSGAGGADPSPGGHDRGLTRWNSARLLGLRPAGCSIDTIRVGGGRVTPLAVADAPSVLWSPRRILYSQGGQIWTANPDGTLRRRLAHLPTGVVPVAVSADGSRLIAQVAVTYPVRPWAVDVLSGRAHPLTAPGAGMTGLAISRDGQLVLADRGCGPTPHGLLFTVPFSGGRPRIVATGPCRAAWNV